MWQHDWLYYTYTHTQTQGRTGKCRKDANARSHNCQPISQRLYPVRWKTRRKYNILRPKRTLKHKDPMRIRPAHKSCFSILSCSTYSRWDCVCSDQIFFRIVTQSRIHIIQYAKGNSARVTAGSVEHKTQNEIETEKATHRKKKSNRDLPFLHFLELLNNIQWKENVSFTRSCSNTRISPQPYIHKAFVAAAAAAMLFRSLTCRFHSLFMHTHFSLRRDFSVALAREEENEVQFAIKVAQKHRTQKRSVYCDTDRDPVRQTFRPETQRNFAPFYFVFVERITLYWQTERGIDRETERVSQSVGDPFPHPFLQTSQQPAIQSYVLTSPRGLDFLSIIQKLYVPWGPLLLNNSLNNTHVWIAK